MNGMIKSLRTDEASGVIRAENGLSVPFDLAAVLAYDLSSLAVGQLVSFDLESRKFPKAVNICVQKVIHPPGADEKRHDLAPLRYVGFDQAGSDRAYRFERMTPGEGTTTFIVRVAMELFIRHHVGIQEGPTLSQRVLVAGPLVNNTAPRHMVECSLTDEDVQAYVATRPVPGAKPGPKRVRVAAAGAAAAVR